MDSDIQPSDGGSAAEGTPAPAGDSAASTDSHAGADSGASVAADQAGADPAADKPGLPGVLEWDGPSRDASGRFAKGQAKAKEDGDQPPADGQVPADGAVTTPPPEPPPKFTFAGRDWDSQEAAEQNLRSLQGQFKPLQERIATAEQNFQVANDSARQWKEVAERLQEEIRTLTGQEPGQPPSADPQGQPAKPPTATEIVEAGRDEFAKLFEHDPRSAVYLFQQHVAEKLEEAVSQRLEAALGPIQKYQGQLQFLESSSQLLNRVSQYVRPGSSDLAFPELRDAGAVREVSSILSSLGFGPENPPSERALIMAVLAHRGSKGQAAGQQSPNPAGQTPPGQDPPAVDPGVAAAAAAVAQAVAADAGGDAVSGAAPPVTRAPGKPLTDAERLRQAARAADSPDPILGFPVRADIQR